MALAGILQQESVWARPQGISSQLPDVAVVFSTTTQFQTSVEPLAEVITVDKWFVQASEFVRTLKWPTRTEFDFDPIPRITGIDVWSGIQPSYINRLRQFTKTEFDFDVLPHVPGPESWTGYFPDRIDKVKQIVRFEFDLAPLPQVSGPEGWNVPRPVYINKLPRKFTETQFDFDPLPRPPEIDVCNEHLIYRQVFQYQAHAEPLIISETITVDKWFVQASEFQRVKKWFTWTWFDLEPLPRVPGPEAWDLPRPAYINRLRKFTDTEFDLDPLPRPPDVENWTPPLQEPQQRIKQIIRQEFDLDPLPRVPNPDAWTGNFPDRIFPGKPQTKEGLQLLYPLPFVPGPEGWLGYHPERIDKVKPLVPEGWEVINLFPQVSGPEGWNPNISEPVRRKLELVRVGENDFDPFPRPNQEVFNPLVTYPDKLDRLRQTALGQQLLDPNPIPNQVTFWYPEYPDQLFRIHANPEPFNIINPFAIGPPAPPLDGWMRPVEIPARSLRPLLYISFPDHDLTPPAPAGVVRIYTLAQTNVGL